MDTTKGLLTLSMVVTHVLVFFAQPNTYVNAYAAFAGLSTFSGFLFCFGYAFYLAYLTKAQLPKARLYAHAFKLLLAFYLSGAAYSYLVDNNNDPELLLEMLLLNHIPHFSEFLLAFALITVITTYLAPVLRILLIQPRYLLLSIGLCLGFTMFKFYSHTVQAALLLGATHYPTFPVIHYLPLFILGAYAAKQGVLIQRYALLYAFIAVAVFGYCYSTQQMPKRFPPATLWILCSVGSTYLYYVLGIYVNRICWIKGVLQHIGMNVLFWLLSSNLFIFALTLKIKQKLPVTQAIALAGTLIAIIYYLTTLVQAKLNTTNPCT